MLFIFIALVIFFIFNLNKKNIKQDDCKLHKWIIKDNGLCKYMVCERCKILPGTDLKEEGN
jgi:hypothetical protein